MQLKVSIFEKTKDANSRYHFLCMLIVIKCGILIILLNVSYVQYQLHTVYIYIYGIIYVTCACIFYSVDVEMRNGKRTMSKAWTVNKKEMQ